MSTNQNNEMGAQLDSWAQKLVEEINNLEDKLAKASKARDRKKLQKQLEEKKAAYDSLFSVPADAVVESTDTTDTPAPAEDVPAEDPETPAETPAKDVPAPVEDNTPAPEVPEETPAPAKDAPKTQAATPKTTPKVSAKDTIPEIKLGDMVIQDKEGKPTTWFSFLVYAVLAVVLGGVAWWYFYKDTATVANTVVYERATAQLREDIQPAWWRWHSWDLEVKGEAIINWMPSYKAVFVDGGNTSTKGEALLYSVGCAIRALTKKGYSVGDAAEKVDAMSGSQLKAVLDADATLTAAEVRAIKRALEN